MTRSAIIAAFALTLSSLWPCDSALASSQEPATPGALFPHEWIGNIDETGFREPSGICYHPQRGTLFVVGDEGDVGELQTDGSWVKKKRLRRGDFEGITCDPSSGLLYVAVERAEAILEMDPETLEVTRAFSIPRVHEGKTLLKSGGQGLEAITFVPDPKHPEGGTFYVSNQSYSLDDPEDISALFEVQLGLRSGTREVRIIRYFRPGVIDLSGLYYDAATDHIFVISDATNAIFEYSRTHQLLHAWAFPGDDQEGIAVDGEGYLYIAQDSGGIIKIRWLRETNVAERDVGQHQKTPDEGEAHR